MESDKLPKDGGIFDATDIISIYLIIITPFGVPLEISKHEIERF